MAEFRALDGLHLLQDAASLLLALFKEGIVEGHARIGGMIDSV